MNCSKFNFMNHAIITYVVLVVFSLSSCKPMKEKADLIVLNSLVYTVNESFETAEAFAVAKGMFIAVGTNDEILNRFDADAILDANGKPIYPGFIDGHCHFAGYGENLYRWADLSGSRSFEEVLQRLKDHHDSHPSEWLLGRGWDQNHWDPPVFPDNKVLEKHFPGMKVLLVRIDGHASLVSQTALEAAGIDAHYTVRGGEVLLNEKGEPSGILIDNADLAVKELIPPITISEKKEALLEAQKKCFAVGLTSVVDAGLPVETIELIHALQQEGRLLMKINAMISADEETMHHYFELGPYADERLTINTVKMFADGALGSRGALLFEPYSDVPHTFGLMLHNPEFYYGVCQKAYDAGFQVSVHAIGDSANRFVLDMYAHFLKGHNDRRWRVEHAQIVHPSDFEKFEKFSIIPSIQSTHATSDMYWAIDRVGDERIKGAYAQQTLLKQNGWLINGTDFPIEGIDPLQTFYAAVFRKDASGFPKGGFLPDQALDRLDAMRSMTIWAAKGSFEDKLKGSIEVGKHADFVMLDKDLMKVPEQDILGINVLATYIHGEKVYQHE